MHSFYSLKFIITAIISTASLTAAVKDIYGLEGRTVEFICPFNGAAVVGKELRWEKYISSTSLSLLAINERINNETLDQALYTRLSIVGNYVNGEYKLRISGINGNDEGRYRCIIGSSGPLQDEQTLYLIVSPTSVNIENVTTEYRLLGTEGLDMTVSCVGVGEKPPPNVTLKVDGTTVATRVKNVTYTVKSVNRSFDRKTITCEASNEANANNPLIASAVFYLNLKPLQPTFSLNHVSTEETKTLVVSCTSNGSRPAATFQWSIGQTTITSGITTTSVRNTADDTYTVTSTLTKNVERNYNGQTLTCGAYHNASTSGVNASTTLDVKYAPDITVTNVTYDQNNDSKILTCYPVGNPSTYTYYSWQHKSKYGELIRELGRGQNLTLPSVSLEARYQESGEYICTADNGIIDKDGKLQQTGSGYVTVNAQPTFTNGNKNTEYGELNKDVDIQVYVYSVPKYSSVKWYKRSAEISMTENKYTLSEAADMVHDIFLGTEVKLDGYRITLTIKNLVVSDFNASYMVEVSNGVGQSVRYNISLESTSPPQMPANFAVLSSTESSILVQWEPGYNGGNIQTFHIEYRVNGSKLWEYMQIPDTKQSGRQTFTLSGLQDDTTYEVRMFAENKFNTSLRTETVSIKTTKADSQASKQIGPIVGGVGGALTAILIIIVVIWFVILKRKQDKSTHSKATRSSSDSEVPDGLQHNILYQSAGSDFKPLVPKTESEKQKQKPSTSETEYAEVQKTNAAYAAVDKTVQKKNVQDKKQTDKKKRPKKTGKKVNKAGNNNPDGEYANAGMSLKDMGEEEYANAADRNIAPKSHKNQQGLEYADLSFTKQIPQKGKKPVIHGGEDRTIYSEVDHSKKAPPPPQESAYEETNFKHG